jgi:hypothetical protein
MSSQRTTAAVFFPAALFISTALASFPVGASLRLGGIIDAAHAMQTVDDSSQKTELTFLPQLEWRSPFDFDLTAIGRVRVDWQDALEPGRSDQSTTDPWSRRNIVDAHTDAEIRELYIEFYPGDSYVKIGKQQIVWGQADGLKVLDRLNPQSYREFILADFETSRIPLWSVKWEFSITSEWQGQLVLIPDQSYHDTPAPGSAFTPTSPELVPTLPTGTALSGHSLSVPDRTLKDGDAGLQLATRWQGWDITLNYLYHYADTPVFRLRDTEAGTYLDTSYERTHMFGGSASNAFGDFTLRTELGYTTDRFVYSSSTEADQGTVRGGELAYVVGLDWMGLRDTLVSAQLFQSWFDRDGIRTSRDSVETDATLLVERHFLNEVLTFSNLIIHDVDRGDGLVSTSLSYDYLANLELRIEVDTFYGSQQGRYGQFDARDRVVIGFEYGF